MLHAHCPRNAELEAMNQVDADMALRRGEIGTTEYLQRTHAIEDYLASQGVDTQKLAGEQLAKSWGEAGEEFRQTSDWPGGNKNLQLIGDKLVAMGLTDAPDKTDALRQAYDALKAGGTLFDGDVSQAQLEAMTKDATPAEILPSLERGSTRYSDGGRNAS